MASGSTKVVMAALIGNAAIAVTKFAASAVTGSAAMFAARDGLTAKQIEDGVSELERTIKNK